MLNIENSSKSDSVSAENNMVGLISKGQNNVFSSPYWFAHSQEQNSLSFIERNGEDNMSAMHVSCNKVMGVKFAELAGEPFIQYNDMYKQGDQSTEEFLNNFLRYLKDNGVDALYLRNVRADAHIMEYCKKVGVITSEKNAPFLNMSNYTDFDEYIMSLSKQTRYMYNRVSRKHDCSYETYVDEQITEDVAVQVIDQKIKQLELRGETSRLFADATNIADLLKMLLTPSGDFQTFVTLFKIDGVLASSSVFFVKNGVVNFYILAMDDDFAKLSPGNAVVLKNIQTAFEMNCQKFDFLAPNSVYKLKWSRGDFVPVYDILVPITHRGKIIGHAYFKNIRPVLKKIYLAVKKRFV